MFGWLPERRGPWFVRRDTIALAALPPQVRRGLPDDASLSYLTVLVYSFVNTTDGAQATLASTGRDPGHTPSAITHADNSSITGKASAPNLSRSALM